MSILQGLKFERFWNQSERYKLRRNEDDEEGGWKANINLWPKHI